MGDGVVIVGDEGPFAEGSVVERGGDAQNVAGGHGEVHGRVRRERVGEDGENLAVVGTYGS